MKMKSNSFYLVSSIFVCFFGFKTCFFYLCILLTRAMHERQVIVFYLQKYIIISFFIYHKKIIFFKERCL